MSVDGTRTGSGTVKVSINLSAFRIYCECITIHFLSRVSCRRQLELNPLFILYLYGLGCSTLTYPSSMQHRWVEPYAQASLGPSVHHRLPQNTNKRTIEKIKNKRILSAPTTFICPFCLSPRHSANCSLTDVRDSRISIAA